MIKKNLLLTFAVILCGTASVAQNIGDYVVGYYVKAYINKKTNEDWRKKAFQSEWTKLNDNSVKNPISQADLEAIIQKLPTERNNENVLQKTTDFYNAIKNKSNETNIEELVVLPPKYEEWKSQSTGKPRFEEDKQELKQILEDEIGKDNPENDKPSKFLSWFIWLCIIGLSAALAYRFRKELKSLIGSKLDPNKQTNYETEPTETTDYQKEYKTLQLEVRQLKDFETDNAKLRTENKRLENENRELKKQIANLENGNSFKPKPDPISDPPKLPVNQPQTLYADAIVDDKFNKVAPNPNEDIIYELLLKSATTAEFTVFEGNKKQVLRNADKIDGCEKTGTNSGATGIQVENGEATLDDFGKWQITKKAKIKFV